LPCALRRWLLGLLRLALAAYRPTLVSFGIA
jgi:hypothetical protein